MAATAYHLGYLASFVSPKPWWASLSSRDVITVRSSHLRGRRNSPMRVRAKRRLSSQNRRAIGKKVGARAAPPRPQATTPSTGTSRAPSSASVALRPATRSLARRGPWCSLEEMHHPHGSLVKTGETRCELGLLQSKSIDSIVTSIPSMCSCF